MTFNIRITADDFFRMIDQLEKEHGSEAADIVYLCLTNRMDPADRDECSHISLNRMIDGMKDKSDD